MQFSVEIRDLETPNRMVVEIYLDKEGLDDLQTQLGHLANEGDDIHFFTEKWGGHPLSERKIAPDSVLSNHLKIVLVK